MTQTIDYPKTLIIPTFEDFRGYLSVSYDQSLGLDFQVKQINQGYSKKALNILVRQSRPSGVA